MIQSVVIRQAWVFMYIKRGSVGEDLLSKRPYVQELHQKQHAKECENMRWQLKCIYIL